VYDTYPKEAAATLGLTFPCFLLKKKSLFTFFCALTVSINTALYPSETSNKNMNSDFPLESSSSSRVLERVPRRQRIEVVVPYVRKVVLVIFLLIFIF
jgi:hypothetical protein